jgi:hypothetical protein
MASASGSQTEGGDGADSTESEQEEDLSELAKGRTLGEGLLDGFARGGKRSRVRRTSPAPFAGEGGRGEHVLVEKRSVSVSASMAGEKRSSWDGLRSGTWGSTLFDSLEHNNKRRPSSPALNARSSRSSPRAKPHRPPDPIPREPTPPLTIDSIQSTYNPFSLFHIRLHLIPEVTLLVTGLLFALYRLHNMIPSSIYPSIAPLPFTSLLSLVLAVPFISLFRRDSHYFKAPFTDERGYRDPKAADDGVAAALILPILLSCACYWDAYVGANTNGGQLGLEGINPLVQVWELSGIHAIDKMNPSFDPAILSSPVEGARALLTARHELVLLTALNSAILVLHLALAKTVFRIEKLPKSNTKRFFGFMSVANLISFLIYVGFTAWDWTRGGRSSSCTTKLSARFRTLTVTPSEQEDCRSRLSKQAQRRSSNNPRSTSSRDSLDAASLSGSSTR